MKKTTAPIKYTSSMLKRALLLLIAFGLMTPFAFAKDEHDESHGEESGHHEASGHHEQEVADVIIHHIMDTHDWHFFDVGETPVALHLPWIIYDSEKGLQFFANTHALEEEPHYIVSHDKVYTVASKEVQREYRITGKPEEVNPELAHEIHEMEASGEYVVIHHKFVQRDAENNKSTINEYKVYKAGASKVYDFSMTKTGLQILMVAILMFFVFRAVAKGYKKNEGKAPKGIQSFMEPIILFVRDEVAKPFLHGKHDRFMPYLLTLFFFIWISNLFGLTPFNSNIAGNTTITVMLASISFLFILRFSTVDFWSHLFWFPGVPLLLKPLMLVVEMMSLLTKPAALAIRLFASISAGHFMILSLISLIFILGDMGHNAVGGWSITPLSLLFGLFIMGVEIIVAAVQAFVFAMLTAVFIGQSMETHGHDDHH